MKKYILLLLLIIGAICSAKVLKIKIEPSTAKDTLRVLKINSKKYINGKTEEEEVMTFFYENNLISKIVTQVDDKVTGTVEIKYEDGKMKEMKENYKTLKSINELSVVRNFNYENDLVKSVLVTENGKKVLKVYAYNHLKQIIKCQNLDGGKLISEEKYTYNENGNLAKEEYQDGDKYFYKKYDNKKNAFTLMYPEAYLKVIRVFKNNVIHSFDSSIGYKESLYYEYEYNSQNYPAKITTKSGRKLKNVSTIEYEYIKN